jgi:hypothetical protein
MDRSDSVGATKPVSRVVAGCIRKRCLRRGLQHEQLYCVCCGLLEKRHLERSDPAGCDKTRIGQFTFLCSVVGVVRHRKQQIGLG